MARLLASFLLISGILVSFLDGADHMRPAPTDPRDLAATWTAALLAGNPNTQACPEARVNAGKVLMAVAAEAQRLRPVRRVFWSPDALPAGSHPDGELVVLRGLAQFADGGEEQTASLLVRLGETPCVAGAEIGLLAWVMPMPEAPGRYEVRR